MTDPVAAIYATLDADDQRARDTLAIAASRGAPHCRCVDCEDARERLRRNAGVRAVVARHSRDTFGVCAECVRRPHPCPTIRALAEACDTRTEDPGNPPAAVGSAADTTTTDHRAHGDMFGGNPGECGCDACLGDDDAATAAPATTGDTRTAEERAAAIAETLRQARKRDNAAVAALYGTTGDTDRGRCDHADRTWTLLEWKNGPWECGGCGLQVPICDARDPFDGSGETRCRYRTGHAGMHSSNGDDEWGPVAASAAADRDTAIATVAAALEATASMDYTHESAAFVAVDALIEAGVIKFGTENST